MENASYTTQDEIDYHQANIVLPRPKGMKIGVAMDAFYNYLHDRRIDAWYKSDEVFLNLWQEWIKSLK